MAELKLLDYQADGIDEITEKFIEKRKILYQLSTGGGKTFVFSFLTKDWIKSSGKRILILCHREELLKQTEESLAKIWVTSEMVTSKKKKLNHKSDVYVSMIETAFNRLKANPFFFKDVDLVIADECHLMLFDKVFDFFTEAKILGCTATPVINKRVKFFKCKHCKRVYDLPSLCCFDDSDEWTRPARMADLYEDIVIGPSIENLINRGQLVKELSIIKDYANLAGLKVGSDGDFTSESMDEAYGGDNATFNVLLNYRQYCEGKKTMIFNSTSKTNLKLYEQFKSEGLNVRMYDSVNKEQSGNRKDLIKWFRAEPDAVLMNVGVFTTGFDVKEVQAIIHNAPTMSLGLYIQIAGRGARCTDELFKDHFIYIDGGGNIDRHGEFSDGTRDWDMIFWNGIGKERIKKEMAFDIVGCTNCGALNAKSNDVCGECGFSEEPPESKPWTPIESEEILTPIRKIPPPDGKRIYEFTRMKGENINFAFKIMISQIVDMFRYYKVSKAQYESNKADGRLDKRIRTMVNKCYFFLLTKADIQADNNRTINYLINKVLEKLEKFYERHSI